MGKLTKGTSNSFQQTMFGDSPECTGSPASESGTTPSLSPDGQQANPSGPEVVPVPASPARGKEKDLATLVTSGLIGFDSSASFALQRSLANKLVQRLDTAGSILYRLTWRERTTPLGRRYLERAALVERTSGRGSTGWPTPNLSDDNNARVRHPQEYSRKRLARPNACSQLADVAQALCGWASPSARVWKDTPGMSETGTNPDGSTRTRLDQLPRQANLAGWPTPQSHDERKRGNTEAGHHYSPHDLSNAADLAGWPTPCATDTIPRTDLRPSRAATGRDSGYLSEIAPRADWPTPMAGSPGTDRYNEAGNTDSSRKTVSLLTHAPSPVRLKATGEMLTGSSAQMESGGQLSPAHSRWLMALPPVWCGCAVTATQSMRKSRKPSSKRRLKS